MTAKADTNPLREALEPCPFCGSADVEMGMTESNWPAVCCSDCGTLGPSTDLHSDKAAEAWNARTALASEPVAGTGQRSSDDESGCPRKCGEATDSGGSGNDRNSEDTMQGDRPAAVVKVPSSERPPAPAGREDLTRAMELAHEYDAGTAKCVASGYQEFGREFQRDRKIISDALRAYASSVTPHVLGAGEPVTLIDERLADLRNANDVFRGMDWDKSSDIRRNDREIRFLIDLKSVLRLAPPPVPGAADRAAVIEEAAAAAENFETGRKWSDDADMQNQAYYTEGEVVAEIAAAIRAIAPKGAA